MVLITGHHIQGNPCAGFFHNLHQIVYQTLEDKYFSGDTNVISINGYRAIVDFFQDSDKTVELTIKFTREGITVQKVIPITVRTVSEEALEKELAAMEYAKAHYFDGINDGKYIDTEHITGNLHAFREFYIDDSGNPVWVYDVRLTPKSRT